MEGRHDVGMVLGLGAGSPDLVDAQGEVLVDFDPSGLATAAALPALAATTVAVGPTGALTH